MTSILPGGDRAGGSPLPAGLQEMQPQKGAGREQRGEAAAAGPACPTTGGLVLAEPHSSTAPGDPHTLPWPRPSSEGPFQTLLQ